MPTQVQFRRGSTAQNNNFTGAAGELSVNTSNNSIRVHDGSTAGGTELATLGFAANATNITSGTLGSSRLPTSGVSADTYGGASKVPVITVDTYGRITSASNVNVAGVSTFSASGNTFTIGTADGGTFSASIQTNSVRLSTDTTGDYVQNVLPGAGIAVSGAVGEGRDATIALTTSGVAATTYGGASKVPVIAIDQYGRITSAANVNVAGVTNFAASGNTFTISTADGGSFSASIQLDSVRLGTDTTGIYVANLVQGAGIALTNLAGENATPTIALDSSGVAASTYGGAAVQPVLTVDAYGRITSASNVTSTVANTNIVGNVISSQITSVNASQITGDIALGTQTSGNYVASITGTSGRVSVSGSASEGATPTVDLSTSGVTANTYGGAAVQPVFTVDAYGRITSASNVTTSVANTNITGNIIASQIAPTGVSAATYGNATLIPSIVVDQQGRITGASNVAVSVPAGSITGDIVLGTQTSGAYVSNLVAGTGVTLSGLGNEGTTPTIAIGQAVSTTSDVTFANVTVTGNLLVQGNTVEFSANTLVINDPLIQVGKSPAGDAVDLGFFGHYIGGSPSIERHAGLFRDATDGQFKLFTNLDPEPATIVDTANATYQSANLVVNFVVGKVSDISNHTTASLAENSANLYYTNARAYANIVAAGFYDTVSNTAPIGASESGTTLTLTHLNSGVAAATYGGAATVPVYTVNATGHITSASNATISIPSSALNTDVALGSQTSGNYIATIAGTSGRVTVSGSGAESAAATIDLATSGVSASTYGGAAVQPVLTVDTYGRITSASNVTSTVANTNITGNIIASQIAVTGVTAGSYGGVNNIGAIVVDQQGRITSAANVASTTAITQVGTISTGTWQGSSISTTYTDAKVTSVNGSTGAVTGLATTAGTLAQFGATTSAQLAGVISDETGSGALVFATSPTLTTPDIGTARGNAFTSIAATGVLHRVANNNDGVEIRGRSGGTGNWEVIITPATLSADRTLTLPDTTGTVITTGDTATVTSAMISSVANSKISGNIISSQLQPTGVTASTYGGASTAAVITIDQQGRITSASNATIAGGVTQAQANSRIAARSIVWGL